MTDDELFQQFSACTLPAADWTHTAHLRIALLHLHKMPLDDAHILIRVGIIKLNASHALVETPVRGYHDTITRAWLVILAAARDADRQSWSTTHHFLERHSPLANPHALLNFYSKERLLSKEARARFVDPDVQPLPTVAGNALSAALSGPSAS